jgi:hypothetical protein
MYNKRKFGEPFQAELKRLSKELLVAKNKAQETFLRSVFFFTRARPLLSPGSTAALRLIVHHVQSYKTKVDAGQSSASMLNDVKEIEKYSEDQGP